MRTPSRGRLRVSVLGEPRRKLSRTILEEASVREDAPRTGCEGTPAEPGVVVLADREHRSAGRVRELDGGHAVVGPGGQVDDDTVDVGQCRRKGRRGPDGDGLTFGAPDEIGQAGRPDQVIGEDRDARGQPSVSAR